MKMEINMTCNEQDLNDIKRVINSSDFTQFLLNKTTSFVAAAWILQTLLDEAKKLEQTIKGEND